MIALSKPIPLTVAEYLKFEEKSTTKHEYINGQIYAMAGTTDNHNIIAGNLFTIIRNHLRNSDCRVYFADVKARLEKRNCFYYPDLMVTCDAKDKETSSYKRFPKLIIEVLSKSTEAFDRGDKFNDYQTLDSLEEYILVNTNLKRIEIYRRNDSNLWVLQNYTPNDQTFTIQSINLTAPFVDIYEDVEWD